MSDRQVALLRAVNVGGHARMSMAALKTTAEAAGFAATTTVLQAGTLIFTANGRGPALEVRLKEALRDRLGFATDVMIRTSAQWKRALAGNPFPALADADPSHLILFAMKAPAKPGAEAALQAAIRGREQVRVAGDMAYIAYPDGIGRSKLTSAVLERHLGTPGTGRNWNTVLKIATLLGVPPGLSASGN